MRLVTKFWITASPHLGWGAFYGEQLWTTGSVRDLDEQAKVISWYAEQVVQDMPARVQEPSRGFLKRTIWQTKDSAAG
eukprot:379584-Lingulodinium_polyedra.AAC.1